MNECLHDIVAQDMAVNADGMCPLCLAEDNRRLRKTMELHAGDCCSLNNEVELFRSHWEDAEERCDELHAENKKLRKILEEKGLVL